MSEQGYEIYISYARADGQQAAERLYHALESNGITAWYDRRAVAPTQDFSSDLEVALARAAHVVVCLTPAIGSYRDSFVLRELMYAQGLEKSITPLAFPGFQAHTAPLTISHLSFLDFTNFDAGLTQLLARLHSEKFVASSIEDPFRDYLNDQYRQLVEFLENDLYKQLVDFLDETVFSFTEHTPDTDDPLMFDTFAEAYDHYDGRVMLFGQAGSGKTITLMAFAREAVSRRLSDPAQPLPLIASIGTWDPIECPPIAAWLSKVIHQDGIAEVIQEGRAVLLLDALDELGAEREDPNTKARFDPRLRFLAALQECPDTNRLLITSRTETNPTFVKLLPVNGVITLRALDEDRLQAYLVPYPDIWAAIQADAALREMVRSPIFLSLFTFTYAEASEQARALRRFADDPHALRREIFYSYVQKTYDVRHGYTNMPFSVIDLRRELEIAAAFMYMQTWRIYVPTPSSSLTAAQVAQTPLNPKIVTFAEELDLLERNSQNELTFVSSLLRDTFAFDRMLAYLKSDEPEIRFGAARGLGLLKQRRAVEPLLDALKHERNPHIQYAIRAALENLKPEYGLFLSYRRSNWGVTFLIEDRLKDLIDARIFLDRNVDESDFETSILRNLRTSTIFMLIATPETFEPGRIHLERDWIRREIREALDVDIPIVMVFVDGTTPPDEEFLPRDIRSIVTRQGFPVYPNSFEQDIVQLADFVTTISPINRLVKTE